MRPDPVAADATWFRHVYGARAEAALTAVIDADTPRRRYWCRVLEHLKAHPLPVLSAAWRTMTWPTSGPPITVLWPSTPGLRSTIYPEQYGRLLAALHNPPMKRNTPDQEKQL